MKFIGLFLCDTFQGVPSGWRNNEWHLFHKNGTRIKSECLDFAKAKSFDEEIQVEDNPVIYIQGVFVAQEFFDNDKRKVSGFGQMA